MPGKPFDVKPSAEVMAVLFDRDGTLVEDVPYNGNPALVRPRPGAHAAVKLLRDRGIRLGVVTNQSGVARGRLTEGQVRLVNARLAELLGPFDDMRYCPHGPDDGCGCRKPAPGMVHDACRALGARPRSTVLIGDIGADVDAGASAGAIPILVPTPVTRRAEIDNAPLVAPDLVTAAYFAVDLLLGVRA
ncbi:D-glycero-alpha-D-manno-heptose-1,7-bisphosphate 7-phosphatase [Actinophytocola sp. NPDC049390]|uniref:D-glycero-alpha-D-manno-heptose-1,7-bisphosphate 7-phosphatase n=1 Tax=Actinophytocola sp. NPDC049390 TaxID=3363894 RepID=UPI0037B8B6D5